MPASALVAHLSTAALGQRYRAARQPIERSHLQIVWLLSQGRSGREVVLVTGYRRRWIAEIVRRYNTGGPAGLGAPFTHFGDGSAGHPETSSPGYHPLWLLS